MAALDSALSIHQLPITHHQSPMSIITIVKLNIARQETFRYTGQVLERIPDGVVVEAFFNRPDLAFHGLVMGQGDRFVEIYFSQRWYNLFEMHDRQDDHLKGWYCNVTLPAEISTHQVAYVDLALDLLVFPGGKQLVLDEDEFNGLELDTSTRIQALAALHELQELATTGKLSPKE
jgi:predicted RNA-binding protein associated with RNAse of E/G family